jgi:ectoine hydroxylase-related dioxygenase (phytanoyl-CoA dioxygenase family)
MLKLATDLHYRGFGIIDFPDPEFAERAARIQRDMHSRYDWDRGVDLRVQDAWEFNEDVRAIAASKGVIDLLSDLYGRRAFPFQTLNFPTGTEQPCHSDSIHFSSIPERFMCGVWVALEDIHLDSVR